MGLSTVTVTTVMWLCHMTGALGNEARSDQDIVMVTLRLNYGLVRAIPNPCAIYTIFTPNANVPVMYLPPPRPLLMQVKASGFSAPRGQSEW